MDNELPGRAAQTRVYRDGAFGVTPKVPVGPERLERAAHEAMSARAWAYIAGSAGMETTAAANRAAFAKWEIVPRMLRDVAERDLGIELFGRRRRTPFLFSPIGVLEMVSREADLAVARAARRLEVPMVISTQGSRSMEQISAEMGDAERWYQLYWSNNDDLVASMVRRAEASGATAIVVTLDTHTLGWRTRDLDIAFLPFARGQGIAQYTSDPVFLELVKERAKRGARSDVDPKPTLEALRTLISIIRSYPGGSFLGKLRSPLPRAAVETFLEVYSRSSLTWDDLGFLREHTSLPILLKGIQHTDDARNAVEHGMDGIVVSNHGGRQVDGAIGSLDALPGIVEAVDGRVPVLFDSGIRCGADVFKALALGASAVAIGRPWVYGLAIAGEEGAAEVMRNLIAELDLTMALAGITNVAEITPDLIRRTG
jgi:lactate 2-monooxygenase